MKKNSFRKKIIRALLLFSVMLIVSICAAVYIYYKQREMEQYERLAFSYAKTAAEYIDGDRVPAYLETGEKDDYYELVSKFLNCTESDTDILYYYVFVPNQNGLVYIWDAENEQVTNPLGYQEEYMEEDRLLALSNTEGMMRENFLVTNDEVYGYIGSAYYPIFNSEGESVALAGVDLSMPDINRNLAGFMAVVITCIIAVILVSIALLYWAINRVLIKPIDKLNEAARNMAEHLDGDEDVSMNIETGDEIQELAGNYSRMYMEIREYVRKLAKAAAEEERIGTELNVAKKIQEDMLPSIFPAFPARHEFDIHASMTPAKEVGGDFYDFFFVDDDHLGLVMADVSGKGVPAALFMMISKTLIKCAAQGGLSPKAVLEQVNNQLCENNEAEMFVTVWLGILEISTGKMICANAGHEYPAVKRKNGSFELLKDKHGFVLAGMEGSRYKEYELELAPGDMIFVYTDGVTEAANMDNKLYGTQQMLQALNSKEGAGCRETVETVHKDIDSFAGDAPQFDDITMLCLKITDRETFDVQPAEESMKEMSAYVESRLKQAGVSKRDIRKCLIAADEVFSNITSYSGASQAEIACDIKDGQVSLIFRDNGKEYDPLVNQDPDITLSSEERELGGLGIFMVKKIMEKVEYRYEDGWNVLTLERRCERSK